MKKAVTDRHIEVSVHISLRQQSTIFPRYYFEVSH